MHPGLKACHSIRHVFIPDHLVTIETFTQSTHNIVVASNTAEKIITRYDSDAYLEDLTSGLCNMAFSTSF
jgi:hypothetical protein